MVNQVNEFLKETRRFYLATVKNNEPKMRPFGASMVFENKLYVVTSNNKDVFIQMVNNPNISILACNDSRKWVRIEGVAKQDNRIDAKQKMLDDNPILIANKRYSSASDPTMAIFYIDNPTINFY